MARTEPRSQAKAKSLVAPATPRTEPPPASPAATFIDAGRRHAMICEAAYFLAARRNFSPGREFEDWLQAETEIDITLAAAMPGARARPVKDGSEG